MLFRIQDCENSDETTAHGEPDEDTSLVRAASRGDQRAFEQLIRKYERFVYRTAYFTTGNEEDAADLTQEILLKLWHGLPTFRGGSHFLTWLGKIARNACADYLRKKQRTVPTEPLGFPVGEDEEDPHTDPPDPSPQADPHTVYDSRERAALLRRAVQSLSEEHRVLIVLRDIEGASYDKIAAILGVETGTVKSRLHRARAQLRAYLAEHGSD